MAHKIQKIGGTAMSPFTVAHARLLYDLENPFVKPVVVVDDDPENPSPSTVHAKRNEIKSSDLWVAFKVCQYPIGFDREDVLSDLFNVDLYDIDDFMTKLEEDKTFVEDILNYFHTNLQTPQLDIEAKEADNDLHSDTLPWVVKYPLLACEFTHRSLDEIEQITCKELFDIITTMYEYRHGIKVLSEFDIKQEGKIRDGKCN